MGFSKFKKVHSKRRQKVSKTLLNSPPNMRRTFEGLIKAGAVTIREAGNVLSGDQTLERLMLRKEIRRVLRDERQRSCLRAALHARERITIHLLHQGSVTGPIQSLSKYDVTLGSFLDKTRAVPPRVIPKLEIKYAHLPSAEAAVAASRAVDTGVKGMALCVPPHVQDRFHIGSLVLQARMKDSSPMRFHLFDGDVVKGVIKWWSQYEIGLAVSDGVALTLFRHAILGVSEVNGSYSAMWKNLPVPGPAKAAAPPPVAVYDPTADMTPAQAEVWRAIEKIHAPWTISDLAAACGLSKATVNNAVKIFEEAEMVREAPKDGRTRCFILVPSDGAK